VLERIDERISGEKSGEKMKVTEPVGKRNFERWKTGK